MAFLNTLYDDHSYNNIVESVSIFHMYYKGSRTVLCIAKSSLFFSRNMFKARNEALISASYSFMNSFFQDNVLHATTVSAKTAVINAAMHYTKTPIPYASLQHRARFVNNVFREKWDVSQLSEVYYLNYPENKSIIVFPQINTVPLLFSNNKENQLNIDSRVFSEIPVINALVDNYRESIIKVYNTLDHPYKVFANQKQSNVDYVLHLQTIEGALKETYADAKSGLHMIKHMTRGHLGLVETINNNQELEFTNAHPLITTKYNITRLRNIENTFDSILKKNLTYVIDHAQVIINNATNPYEASYLWHHIQRNPRYDRSLSFVFQTEVNPMMDTSEKYVTYKKRFVELLGEQKSYYDIDSIADRKVIFKAMIVAFAEVEPCIKPKLSHMKGTIVLDSDLLIVMNKFIENTLK